MLDVQAVVSGLTRTRLQIGAKSQCLRTPLPHALGLSSFYSGLLLLHAFLILSARSFTAFAFIRFSFVLPLLLFAWAMLLRCLLFLSFLYARVQSGEAWGVVLLAFVPLQV